MFAAVAMVRPSHEEWPHGKNRIGASNGAIPRGRIVGMETFPVTERTRVRRVPQRATHVRDDVRAVLDAGFVCHLGFVADGRPIVIPTTYVRIDDTVAVHGSAASRTLEAAADGVDVCLVVTLLDGLVLARSAFHHSVNYRSAVVFGRGRAITDEARKLAALRAFTDRVAPGRWDVVREPNAQEMKATLVLERQLQEAVAKIRTGGPIDDEQDLALPVWAGVIPLATQADAAIPATDCAPGTTPPAVVLPGLVADGASR
jgi:nitroimidazol reductase NimA-like FMN-containing flavoprotein (pyridoxamine 5'-phosphate oxidase superfamily)